MSKYSVIVGVDTGVNTGISVWNPKAKCFVIIDTVPIHKAMEIIQGLWNPLNPLHLFVRVEDARKRKWFGSAGREQLQGAGSIKRDAKIFEDFLTDLGVPFEMIAPKNNKTKLSADAFKKITGWQGRTSVHGRDASMLIFQM